jgi:predicted nucleic acid-binding protein
LPETVADTGPVLHLHEIGRLPLLKVVSPITIPDLVESELEKRGIRQADLHEAEIAATVSPVHESVWRQLLLAPGFSAIQPADAQVYALAQASGFRALTVTDDLTLRKLLEDRGASVVGTVGIILKGYSTGKMDRRDLDLVLAELLTKSTLRLSRAFRAYLRTLFAAIP